MEGVEDKKNNVGAWREQRIRSTMWNIGGSGG